MNGLRIALIVSLSVCICSTTHATLALLDGGAIAQASDGLGERYYSNYRNTSIPTVPNPLLLDSVDGVAYSKNSVNWFVVGGQTVFSYDTTQARTGLYLSSTSLSPNFFIFVVDEPTTYEMSGYFSVTDAEENESGEVQLFASLFDHTTHEYLYSSRQWSKNTHNEQFVVGERGGDFEDTVQGSLRGTIPAGHTISFDFGLDLRAWHNDFPASAVGNVTLKIGTIPEPSSVALCSIFSVLGLIRRRQIA